MKKSLFKKLNENSKEDAANQDTNYHLCLTTQSGLVDYYKLYEKHGYNYSNVIGYDYELMNEYVRRVLEKN